MEYRNEYQLRKHWESNEEVAFQFPTFKAYLKDWQARYSAFLAKQRQQANPPEQKKGFSVF